MRWKSMEEKKLGSSGLDMWLLEVSIPDLAGGNRKVDLAEVRMCTVEVNKTHPFSSWCWLW